MLFFVFVYLFVCFSSGIYLFVDNVYKNIRNKNIFILKSPDFGVGSYPGGGTPIC